MEEKSSQTIKVNIIDSEPWKNGLHIIKISENEFVELDIDPRVRLNKRIPEYWIFIDGPTNLKPLGLVDLLVRLDQFGMKHYRLCKNDFHKQKLLENVHIEQKPLYNCSHSFQSCFELKIIFCERCGKIKYI